MATSNLGSALTVPVTHFCVALLARYRTNGKLNAKGVRHDQKFGRDARAGRWILDTWWRSSLAEIKEVDMGQRREDWRWLSVACGLIVVGTLVSCNSGTGGGGGGGNQGAILKRPSKSGAIAITGDDKYVIQVNPENDSVTTFRVSTNEKVAEIPVGKEPFSVVIAPDDQTAFVANREDGTVMKLSGINSSSPSVVATVSVGSEPTGIAMAPCGGRVFVTEFAESRVSVWSADDLKFLYSKPVKNPRALAITNDGDTDCNDEQVVVTEFYGRNTGEEAKDDSRTGVVRILRIADLGDTATVLFPPVAPGAFGTTALTGPNQLSSVNIIGNKFYVTATGASPDGVPKFNENVFPLVLVGDVAGNKLGTISLADAIKTQVTVAPKNFIADMLDVAFVGNIGYFLGRGADAIQRATFTSDSSVTLGSGAVGVQQIDLLGQKCQNPIGVVTPHNVGVSPKMFVNCWVSRNTAVVDLDQQKAITAVAATNAPVGLEATVNKGRRFYFTGRGRWSNEAWSSCASCHPDGLSDNITWRFPSGPRQATSMDSTFSHGPGAQKERILNWSAIFDELHDFERNTRAVSGGKGAVTTGAPCLGDLSGETAIGLNPADAADPNGLKVNLGIPVKEIQDNTAGNCVKDWDEIDEFVKTIRPPKAKRFTDTASVSRGRKLFTDGKCQNCHGGAGWTVSRRFYTPAAATNTALAALDVTIFPGHTKMIQPEQGVAGVVAPGVVPAQVACVLRVVNSFGVPGNVPLTTSLEQKQGNSGIGQGSVSGYNVPGLYGLAVGAPYLHHGQAKTLEDLFGDPKWLPHLQAGGAVFNNGAVLSGQNLDDLVNFLTSIDANTPEEAIPSGQNLDKCPLNFP
jgi:YVTN family beta-propeller protein